MKTKQTKAQRIADLERQLHEAKAAQVHTYYFASTGLDKLSTDRLMGSGVVLSMTMLGGKTTFKPVLIRDGLSKETIAAIKADLARSYKLAVELKPEGA